GGVGCSEPARRERPEPGSHPAVPPFSARRPSMAQGPRGKTITCEGLRISIEFNKGRLGGKEDWANLDPEQDHTFSKPNHKTVLATGISGARQRLAGIVSDLVELGAVQPDLVWQAGHWNIFYHGVGN